MAYELATGGSITVDTPTLVEHTFTSGGTFSLIATGTLPVSGLSVAGGGGGGNNVGGGGGAGGVFQWTPSVTSDLTIVVGDGGAGATSTNAAGANGNDTTVTGLTTAVGGGGGAGNVAGTDNAGDGGSGGGGGIRESTPSAGVATGAQGNDGGVGRTSSTEDIAGGGGGAGAVGGNATSTASGDGGAGSEWPTASGTYYGGGGGGGHLDFTAGGAGGIGGGGNSPNLVSGNGNPGTANTGGGGGGGNGTNGNGGSGGSGVVIIRYDPADFVSDGVSTLQAAETDLAQPVKAFRGLFATATQSAETDLAQPVVPALIRLVGQATETDLAQAIIRFQAAQAAETDLAQPITINRTYPVGQATETDLAQPFTINRTYPLGQAAETDLAQPITANKTKALGQAAETDLAQPVSFVGGLSVDTIEAAVLIGPFIQQGYVQDEIMVNSILSATVMTGPLWIANDNSDPYVPAVTVVLVDEDGVSVVAGDPLATAFNVAWFDEINGTGYGTFDILLSETAAVAEVTLLRFVRCYVGAVEAFCWRIEEQPQIVEVAGDEEYGQILQVRGRGWAGVLDDAVVYPVIPTGEVAPDLTTPWLGANRVFSFASPDYPDLFLYPSLWPNVESYYDYGTLQPGRFERVETSEDVWENLPSPVGLPFPASEVYPGVVDPLRQHPHWIWPNSNPFVEGWGFFVGDLLYPDTARPITITVSADNLFTLFVDGTPILGENVDTWMWKGWKEVTSNILTNRKYRFACAVKNTAGTGYNPGGFLLSCTYGDDNNVIEDVALVSNLDWRGLYSADAWPGWSSGQIIFQLINEVNTRRLGNVMIPIAYDFNGSYGSDGKSWVVKIDGVATVHIPWFSASHGSSYLEALDALHQDGWVNWRMASGGLTLQMWSYDSVPYDSGATYVVGTSIKSLERTSSKRYANVLLVSYDGGFVEVKDTAAIAIYGYHEDVLSSDATSLEEAQRIGGSELVKRARDPEGGAIVMEIEPVDDTDTPYLAYLPGDGVNIPSPQGGNALVRVMSIAVKQDDMGDAEFILELNKRWPVQDRDLNRVLRSIGGKTLGEAGTRGKVT